MSEAVLLSVLGPGGIAVLVIGGIFGIIHNRKAKARDDVTEVIREQVQNSHGTNLRDDVDRVIALLETVVDDLRGVRKDVGRLDDRDIQRGIDTRNLADRFEKHLEWAEKQEDRLDDIEDTQNPRKDP